MQTIEIVVLQDIENVVVAGCRNSNRRNGERDGNLVLLRATLTIFHIIVTSERLADNGTVSCRMMVMIHHNGIDHIAKQNTSCIEGDIRRVVRKQNGVTRLDTVLRIDSTLRLVSNKRNVGVIIAKVVISI